MGQIWCAAWRILSQSRRNASDRRGSGVLPAALAGLLLPGWVGVALAATPVQQVAVNAGAVHQRMAVVQVTPQHPVSSTLPGGRHVRPVGELVGTDVFPTGIAAYRGAIAVLSNGPDPVQTVTLYDPRTLKVRATFRVTDRSAPHRPAKARGDGDTPAIPDQSLFQGLAAGHHDRLYVAGGDSDDVLELELRNGQLREADRFRLRWQPFPKTQYPYEYQGEHGSGRRHFYVDGVCAGRAGHYLYATGLLANALARINLKTHHVAYLNVGPEPYACAVSADGSTVAVSLWGGSDIALVATERFKRLGDIRLVAHGGRRFKGAGPHPTALIAAGHGTRFWVTLANADQVVEVDAARHGVVRRLHVHPYSGAPPGSQPDALAIARGRLFVANAGNNDVAVFSLKTGARLGLVPAGWYPTALVTYRNGLFVAAGKGLGVGANTDRAWLPSMMNGLLQRVDLAHAATPPAGWTRGALTALGMSKTQRATRARANARATAWLRSHIRHVVFILRENKTFDEELGDYARAGRWADPHLAMYGHRELPNLYALANRYALFSNFYANGEVTAAAHQWTTGADESDYVQRTWPAYYSGRGLTPNPGWTQPLFKPGFGPSGKPRGDNPFAIDRNIDALGGYSNPWIAYPPRRYLFDDMLGHGISFEDFGEFVSRSKIGDISPAMRRHIAVDFPGWDRMLLDTYRARIVTRWIHAHATRLPRFLYIWLPDDHTAGANPCYFTPDYYVADNDAATGRIIASLSRLPSWRHTLVLITEDDTQSGADHISAFRTFLVAAGPWVSAGKLVTARYSQVDVVRTIEAALGLPPLSQWDANARVLRGLWRKQPDDAPYAAKAMAVPPHVNAGTCRSNWLELRRRAGADGSALTLKWLKAHQSRHPAYALRAGDAYAPTRLLSTPSAVMMRQEWVASKGLRSWRRVSAYLAGYARREHAPMARYRTRGDD